MRVSFFACINLLRSLLISSAAACYTFSLSLHSTCTAPDRMSLPLALAVLLLVGYQRLHPISTRSNSQSTQTLSGESVSPYTLSLGSGTCERVAAGVRVGARHRAVRKFVYKRFLCDTHCSMLVVNTCCCSILNCRKREWHVPVHGLFDGTSGIRILPRWTLSGTELYRDRDSAGSPLKSPSSPAQNFLQSLKLSASLLYYSNFV